MEPEGSVPCSQEAAHRLYPEPDATSSTSDPISVRYVLISPFQPRPSLQVFSLPQETNFGYISLFYYAPYTV